MMYVPGSSTVMSNFITFLRMVQRMVALWCSRLDLNQRPSV